ncbi:MAG: RHS repeat-associated core domain-containing protein [Armatimonadota bacterium]
MIRPVAKTTSPERRSVAPSAATSSALPQAAPRLQKVPDSSNRSLLDEVGHLAESVSGTQIAAWKAELHAGKAPGLQAARLHLRLGEWELAGHEEPGAALYHFRTAAHLAPVTSPQHGLALYEIAVTHFRQGAYRQAAAEFKSLLYTRQKRGVTGYSPAECALFLRHALACSGYHEERSKFGIPEPPKLDPECGAAGLAVCLKALKFPYDKKVLLASTRVTGLGSNMQDLMSACDKLGGGRWVTGRVVSADDAGLKALPLPAVAYVEHDHFVAVTRADNLGVTYVCSDCGEWPGGEVKLTWKQWHKMEPRLYLSVVKKGSSDDALLTKALALAANSTEKTALATRLKRGIQVASSAPVGPLGNGIDSAVAAIAQHVVMAGSGFNFPGIGCGLTFSLHCAGFIECLLNNLGGLPGGPACGDPVNLATLEEEYTPEPDLVVYNPNGPAVVWQRIYNSLRAPRETTSSGGPTSFYVKSDFGRGWSNNYNVCVYRVKNPTTGVSQLSLSLANGAGIPFYSSSAPTSSVPLVHCSVQAGAPCTIDWGYDPNLNSSATGNYYFLVTWKDGTKWKLAKNLTYNTPTNSSLYALNRIENRTGQGINFNYVTSIVFDSVLGTITDDANQVLLTVNRASGPFESNVTSVEDRYNRSVYYETDTSIACLTQVSQIVPTGTTNPPARFTFGYQSLVYDGDGTLAPFLHTITVPSPTGTGTSSSTINYDPSSLYVTSLVDANGNTHTFTVVNGTHTKVTVTNPQSQVEFSYTGQFNNEMSAVSKTDGNNNVLYTKTYGDPNTPFKPSSVTDSQSRTAYYTWDSFGNPLSSTSTRGLLTTYTWDYTNFALGRLTEVEQGTKPSTTYTYFEPSGLLNTATGPSPTGSGTVSASFTYDSLGNVLTATGPGNNAASTITTTFNYTTDGTYSQSAAIGRPLTVTDSLGHTSHARYSNRGMMTVAWDALGNTTSTTYNIADQLLTVLSPATGQTGTGNSSLSNVYQYPGGPLSSTRLYDENGAQIRQVSYTYGLEGEMLTTTGSTEPVTNTYDALYRVKTLADGNSNVTTYNYNTAGYVSSIVLPGSDTTQFTSYDVAGHLLQRIDGRGVVTNYEYNDSAGALTDIKYPAHTARNAQFSYDGYGRRTSKTDGTGSESYTYGNLDQLLTRSTTYTGLSSQTISYSYYANGSRSGMTTPGGSFSYSFDAAGRPASLTNPFSETTSWSYANNNWLSAQVMANGVVSAYTYNALGQTTDLLNSLGSTTLSQFGSITHDGVGNRLSVAASVPSVSALSGTTGYSYDIKDQLTGETSTRNSGYTFGFGYDSAGNPTTFKGVGRSYNSKNQLTSGSSYVYDGNGNPTTYAGTSLAFDENDKATTFGSALAADYTIEGVRAWKQDASSNRTYFLYDSGRPIVELDGSGSVSAVNTFGANGLISRRSSSASVFYTFDERGNTTQRLNSSGGVITSHISDAFGVTVSSSATNDPYSGFGAQSGYYRDHETGLILCTLRYYDPGTGRWLNRDPIGYSGGINLYSYCQNNAVNRSDWTGTEDENKGPDAPVGVPDENDNSSNSNGNGIPPGQTPDAGSTGSGWVGGAPSGSSGGRGFSYIPSPGMFPPPGPRPAPSPASSGPNINCPPQGLALLSAEPKGSALKDDTFHRASTFMRGEAAENGQHFPWRNGDGTDVTLTQIPGGLNDKTGIYEYIVDSNGDLTHQIFIPGGIVSGSPNQKPRR